MISNNVNEFKVQLMTVQLHSHRVGPYGLIPILAFKLLPKYSNVLAGTLHEACL